MKSVKEADLKNKRVLMRAGFDVAIDKKGNIIDDTRIREALPTIKYVLGQKPKELIIISHLGRPKGKVVSELRLNKVAERLRKLLDENNSSRPEASNSNNLQDSQFVYYQIIDNTFLLENIRFYPEEEKNDPNFAKKLASLGEVFVFEAFSVAHREHASTVGIMDYLPSFAGFEMEKEVRELSKLFGEVERPYVVIIGGAKTEDKAPVIKALKNKADKILVGGRTSNLLRQEKKYLTAKNIMLTIDGLNKDKRVIAADKDPMAVLDIGPKTIKLFKKNITSAGTILLSGPLGKVEELSFSRGTKEIYEAAAASSAYKVAAGGDTIEALHKFKLFAEFDFVSTGGGAALEFLAKGTLPVIEKL